MKACSAFYLCTYLQGCIEQSSGPNNLNKLTFDFIVTPTEELEWGILRDLD